MNDRVALALVSALLLLAPVTNARAQDAGGVAAPIMVPVAGAVTARGGGLTVTAQPDATYGVAGADWDLTEATAESLGVTTTSTIGALRLRTAPGN